jgi:hypothetical protein
MAGQNLDPGTRLLLVTQQIGLSGRSGQIQSEAQRAPDLVHGRLR